MKLRTLGRISFEFIIVLVAVHLGCCSAAARGDQPQSPAAPASRSNPIVSPGLELDLRSRVPAAQGEAGVKDEKAIWDPKTTAVVICDMWDRHWCQGASARVAEMAPRLNNLVVALRRRGVLIIHCPSDTMSYYRDQPARQLALRAPKVPLQFKDAPTEPPLPIDASDEGCDCQPKCQVRSAWSHEIDAIHIEPEDAIGGGDEVLYLMKERGIRNVLILGVHVNMCVLGRPFAIRRLVQMGENVALVRDLTDSMYNHQSRPWVDHFSGTDLVIAHIERYLCPTITSDQVLGGKPFRFAADTRR
jgi:nicotinamidase-related amidase